MPVIATTLELLAARGPLGPIWWRYGRSGRHSPIEALENPNNRAAYDQRQKAREKKARQAHRELMRTLACVDCGNVPEAETTWVYGSREWTRRPGGRCWTCHQDRNERLEREAEEQLEAARTANAAVRPCWTCRGSIGGEEGSVLELTGKAGPGRLECPRCERDRAEKDLSPLVLPAPTRRELVAALVSASDDPWWEERVLHAKLYPAKGRRV
ncbi:hypothetical protein [Kitasatospora sp. NPDC098663]|uniref:hypothetical protein n=1 Tax=Kitasatospora sp. NPDC098663 TaxID=3364096 RepID=UPI00382881DC